MFLKGIISPRQLQNSSLDMTRESCISHDNSLRIFADYYTGTQGSKQREVYILTHDTDALLIAACEANDMIQEKEEGAQEIINVNDYD